LDRTVYIQFVYVNLGREILRCTVLPCIYTVLANPRHAPHHVCTRAQDALAWVDGLQLPSGSRHTTHKGFGSPQPASADEHDSPTSSTHDLTRGAAPSPYTSHLPSQLTYAQAATTPCSGSAPARSGAASASPVQVSTTPGSGPAPTRSDVDHCSTDAEAAGLPAPTRSDVDHCSTVAEAAGVSAPTRSDVDHCSTDAEAAGVPAPTRSDVDHCSTVAEAAGAAATPAQERQEERRPGLIEPHVGVALTVGKQGNVQLCVTPVQARGMLQE
jgi:hypothetical protein